MRVGVPITLRRGFGHFVANHAHVPLSYGYEELCLGLACQCEPVRWIDPPIVVGRRIRRSPRALRSKAPLHALLNPRWREHDAYVDCVEVSNEVVKKHPENPIILGPVVDHPIGSICGQIIPFRRVVCPPTLPLLHAPRIANLEEPEVMVLLHIHNAVCVAPHDSSIKLFLSVVLAGHLPRGAQEVVLLDPQLKLLPQETVAALIRSLGIQQVDHLRVSPRKVLEGIRHGPTDQVLIAPAVDLCIRLFQKRHPDLTAIPARAIKGLSCGPARNTVVDRHVLPLAVFEEADGVNSLGGKLG
mmetsp:Transcript_9636/g.23748  ORF Transcript_9636/g.23748 Transcript_9636/m.23748 type:complete len:300 (-) Transcript_9636:35-934(-)